jgi:glucose/arabinose dehydrogenase
MTVMSNIRCLKQGSNGIGGRYQGGTRLLSILVYSLSLLLLTSLVLSQQIMSNVLCHDANSDLQYTPQNSTNNTDTSTTIARQITSQNSTISAGSMLRPNSTLSAGAILRSYTTSSAASTTTAIQLVNQSSTTSTGTTLPLTYTETNPIIDRVLQTPARQAPTDIVRRFNCGGPTYIDNEGQRWNDDIGIAKGGKTYSKSLKKRDIANADDDEIYSTYRYGQFTYEIKLPKGDYEVFMYLAEINFDAIGKRVFSITIQNTKVFNKIDVIVLGKRKNYVAIKLEAVAQVTGSKLTIGFVKSTDQPFINALEIRYLKPHLAHAVPGGPYYGVDEKQKSKGTVRLDGSLSHTHGVGLFLNSWEWKIGAKTIASGETTEVTLPVGAHSVALHVKDSAGNKDFAATTITIFPLGYPAIDEIYPTSGNTAGGSVITIYGSGFRISDSSLTVRFGENYANKKFFNIISDIKIEVQVPASTVATPVNLIVETSKGKSNAVPFTYLNGSPIAFTSAKLENFEIGLPTVLMFDNGGLLYIATADGKIARLKLSDDFKSVKGAVVSSVLSGRTILGIAADPMSPQGKPDIYVSHSTLFHGESKSTSGLAINGKVSLVKGANLDLVVDIITNLPVSDHDHAVNGLEFGDNGELYVQVGGNTNAGIPGSLSGSRLQKENPLSAATLVADLSDPQFDGNILYDADDDGNVVGGKGIRVFASGLRNSFGITLHSNGLLYATDNGPNKGYGKRSDGCGSKQEGNDPDEPDTLNLLLDKRYYGHPNRKRGESDAEQCKWQSVNSPQTGTYKEPLMTLASSTNGVIEFQTNQFEGQLRHNLIVS